jgi:uncharacterized protein YbjT (DUF2867 family)
MVSEQKNIFVTDASGQTGCYCVKHLMAKYGDQVQVCAGVYAEKAEEQVHELKRCHPKLNVCLIDAEDVELCAKAFQDASELFIVPSATEAKVRHARNYLQAAKLANVPFVLVLSMTGSDERRNLFADQFSDIEEELKRLQLPCWAVIRSNFYAQNLLLYRDQIARGKLPLPVEQSSKFAPVDAEDVGKAAAEVLANCESHKGKVYTITGPELLTPQQVADQMKVALGKKIDWTNIPAAEARTILRSHNVPQAEVQGLLEFYHTVSQGNASWISNDFKTITGSSPTTMHEFFKKHLDEVMSEP